MASLNGQTIASSYEQLLHVDADGGGNGTTHVSVKDGDNGTTFGFTIATDALMMTSTNRLEFGDNASYIHQSADGVLDLVSDTEIEINATTVDINGAVDISGLTTVAANITVSGSDPTSINAGEIAGDNDVLGINIKNTNTGDGTGGMLKFMSDNGDAITAIAHNQSANTSGEMLFFTENSGTFAERMKIDSSGKVGVGVSPAKLFHVEGSVGGDFLSRIKNTDGTNGEGLQIHADNTNSASRALDVRNSNGQIFQVYNDGNIVIKGDGSDQTTKWHSGSAYVNAKLDVRQLAIAFSGSDKVTSDTSGNFTFANTLTVGSIADEGDAIITNGADAGRYDVLTVKEDGNTRWELSFEGNGSTNSLTFGSNVTAQNIANGGVLTLLPDGNVGINSNNPTNLFTVKSGGAGSIVKGIVLENNGDTNIAGTLFEESFSGGTCGELRLNSSNSTKVLISGNSTSYINNGSNFGIGTNSPRSKFHVEDATNRGVRFFSKSTTGISEGSQTTSIGTFSTKYDGTGNGHACMVDAVVTARVSQTSSHASVRTVALRLLIARSGNEGGGDNTSSNATIIETSSSVLAETGSAGTMNSISFKFQYDNGSSIVDGVPTDSSSTHNILLSAVTNIDTGSGCAIDFIGLIYGHETIEFS